MLNKNLPERSSPMPRIAWSDASLILKRNPVKNQLKVLSQETSVLWSESTYASCSQSKVSVVCVCARAHGSLVFTN